MENKQEVGTYYVDAMIQGRKVSMLVDTGAAYSVLNRDVVNHLHLTPKEQVGIMTAHGHRSKVNLFVLPELVLQNCKINDVEFVVLPNQINILGLTALRKMSPLMIKLDESAMVFDCPTKE